MQENRTYSYICSDREKSEGSLNYTYGQENMKNNAKKEPIFVFTFTASAF
jgi:hypothetical protein